MGEYIEFFIYYPYELNDVLNQHLDEQEKVSNYTSLLTDKDRFDNLLRSCSVFKDKIEEIVGVDISKTQSVYVVRAELFYSCSEPLLVEYQIQPEKMVLLVFKEMIKNALGVRGIRFIDELQQEELLNGVVTKISKIIDTSINTGLYDEIDFLHKNSTEKLSKKDLVYQKDRSDSITISKENTLLDIIEQSFQELY